MSRLAELKKGTGSTQNSGVCLLPLILVKNYRQTLPPRVCITAYEQPFALQEFRLDIWVGNISFFCTMFLLMSGIITEKNWVTIIFKEVSGTEAEERITCKAVALYSKKSSGKLEGISENCNNLWEEQESDTLVGTPEFRWTVKRAV